MGIQRKKRASGKVLFYARLYFGGKQHVAGGFATRAVAERALVGLHKRRDAAKAGEPEPIPRYDPPLGVLLGDPDAEAPSEGSFLAYMGTPGAKRPSYVTSLRTCIRALLTCWNDKRASEVNGDTIRAYQRHRQGMASRMGAYQRERAEARREEAGLPPRRKRRAKAADLPKIGPTTVNKETTVLRTALSWAASSQRDARRRIEPVEWPRKIGLQKPERKSKVLLPEDETRLMRECRPAWLRDLCLFLRDTALRCGEAVALTWRTTSLDNRLIVLETTKTHRGRVVPMTPEAIAMLRKRKAANPDAGDDDLVFTRSTGARITSAHAAAKFLLESRRLGLRTEGGVPATLHGLRHTAATLALRNGFGESEVAEWLGHAASSTVTKTYINVSSERMRVMVEATARDAKPKLAIVPKAAGGEG